MPPALLGLFALGTIGFWILIPLVVLFLFFMVEYEKLGFSTLSLIATFLALAFLGDFNLWFAMRSNPIGSIVLVVGYFVVGALWSVGKWWFFVRERRSSYQEFRDAFTDRNKLPKDAEIPNELKKTFKERLDEHNDRRRYSGSEDWKPLGKPLISENKSRLTMWMTYWPWSMTWTMINDPVKKAFRWVLDQLHGVYQHMADVIFKDVEKDIAYVESKVEPKEN
jgi:hypothetical protein